MKFKSTLAHANAGGLSRLSLNGHSTIGLSTEARIFNTVQIDFLLVTASQVKQATSTDPMLSTFERYTKNGWPDVIARRHFVLGALSLPLRVTFTLRNLCFVPDKLLGMVLQEFYSNYPGINHTKKAANVRGQNSISTLKNS